MTTPTAAERALAASPQRTKPMTDRDELVEQVARALILADDGGYPDAILSATKHAGDCTEGAWTCALCQAVEYRHSARAAILATLKGVQKEAQKEAMGGHYTARTIVDRLIKDFEA
jgi:hypothetical protein